MTITAAGADRETPRHRPTITVGSTFERIAQAYTCVFAVGPLTTPIGRLSAELSG